jgi:hypothetical protein
LFGKKSFTASSETWRPNFLRSISPAKLQNSRYFTWTQSSTLTKIFNPEYNHYSHSNNKLF